MPNERETQPHRLETPDGSRRSRSRSRRDSVPGQRRSRVAEYSVPRESERLRDLERQVHQERGRLRDLQHDLERERDRMRRTVSNQRERIHQSSRHSTRDTATGRERLSRRRERSPHERAGRARSRSIIDEPENPSKKPKSPTFTSNDVINLLNSFKNVPLQPSTLYAQSSSNHKNILSDFDPSSKTQRMDIWLKKVNECAAVYGWDDKTTIHFALQKLQGLAKVWYESLPSILFNWNEWQEKLISAFPCEINYGQALEDMLKRKSRFNEPIEVYYYDKLALLNQCNIEGKRAVDCIIHGLTDKTIKSSAVSLRCSEPEQLLQFLMSNKETFQVMDRTNYKTRLGIDTNTFGNNKMGNKVSTAQNNSLFCFNCKEKGHPFLKCPKPIVRCNKCNRVGHKTDDCFSVNRDGINDTIQKTMLISNLNPSSKFYKDIYVNNVASKGFVDFGSDVSLIGQSFAACLGLSLSDKSSILKGFGNQVVQTLGTVQVILIIDGVRADVECQVVDDKYLEVPILIGQTFTEQQHVTVCKTSSKLSFFDINNEVPFSRYFRKFIKNFASLAHPLTKLLTKDAPWTWTYEQEEAFKTLKDKLINRPILAIFDPTAETELHTDANRMISDRGTCFTSHAFRKFCLDKGVKHVLNAVASPRSNGQVERQNKSKVMIRANAALVSILKAS
ncbi:uncharacterized protein [Epargyreus clarus]|uniref:uncharacterized protein n=1 Tax=Epargyreus clarus TaxID=520877 RepID=UPI003C2F18E1